MSLANQKLRGFVEHKLDSKGRVSVPLSWRPENGMSVFLMLAHRYEVPVLRVFTEDAFDRKLCEIEESEDLDPGTKDELGGYLHANSVEAQVNEQGKLLIPKHWAEERELGLPGAAMLVGRGDYFEMMNLEQYRLMKEREMAENAALRKRFGIS